MKNIAFVVIALMLTGCGVELVASTAIQGELQAQQLKAVSGQVSRVADTSAKINIQHAIDTYLAETGRYPARLDDLVPNYLPSLPTHPGGTPYAYDPAQGKLLDAPAAQTMPVAGAGPMGEAMTGIGIQNQLNSMSQAGASSAQGHARDSLGAATGQHNQEQEKALKDLGM